MARIAIVYHSGTGNTEKMALLIAEGATRPGIEVETCQAGSVDMDKVVQADGFALGSPDYYSYMAGELKTFFDRALKHKDKLSGKPYVSFGSHGGGARVLESIDKLSGSLGLKEACPGVMSLGAPAGGDEDDCRKLGQALAEAVASQ